MSGSILVVGLGEVGKPLLDVISQRYGVVGIDTEPVEFGGECEIMHICYSFGIDNFVGESVRYIDKYRPRLTIVDSTVAPGTSREICEATGTAVVHSPVRGKHIKMGDDLLRYAKFIGSSNQEWGERAARHFESLGMRTRILSSPEASELAKLCETSYFGLMIAWAQEVERYCDEMSLNYDEIVSFYEEIDFFPPVRYFPGVIGGHCVMPNIAILRRSLDSDILRAMEKSNELKVEREAVRVKKVAS